MSRRTFLTGVAAAAATGLAAPAVAQTSAQVRWRLTSSFPKSLDALFLTAEQMAARVAETTGGEVQIQVFAAGEIVPGLSAMDAVSNGTVDMCHTASHYYLGRNPTFMLGTTFPFGMTTRLQNAWFYQGGGNDLLNDFYKQFNIVGFPAGNTGAQMGGWFRKEINSVEDLKGLKFRIAGVGGEVLSRLGAVPQLIAGGDIYPALERGTIDAAEWIGPYDDLKLGFHKVAPNYYYPGWWENSTAIHAFINRGKWEALKPAHRAAILSAMSEANTMMVARYDAGSGAALRQLVAEGAKLKSFPIDVIEKCFETAQVVLAEKAASNPEFKKIYDHLLAFRRDTLPTYLLTEGTANNVHAHLQRKGLI
jgi:TRAP-type mannitol/chloroaromatic compound transport system substrate-binding protein